MPLVRVESNQGALDAGALGALQATLTDAVVETLSKPKKVVMTAVRFDVPLTLGGEDGPAALVELASIGTLTSEQSV